MATDSFKIADIQKALLKEYEFRYNEVLGLEEFKRRKRKFEDFHEIEDYDLNSIIFSLYSQHLICSKEMLRMMLKSDFVQKYNPFKSYLSQLSRWDKVDYIQQLAQTVDTNDNEFFEVALKKWLVAMVASLLVDKVTNHTVLVFTGGQGIGKTSWLKKLVPRGLENYYFEGAIEPANKDDKIQLAENMLINIDELQSLKPAKLEALKALITSSEVKVRKPYGRNHETMPRRASFAGSVNHMEFLSDTSGNRRFLCFEVYSINYQHEIPIDKIFSQAYHLFNDDFRYWFNYEEIKFLNQHNEMHREMPLEEELVLKHIQPCGKDDKDVQFGSATDIIQVLLDLAGYKSTPPKLYANTMGKVLHTKRFETTKKRGVNVYCYKFYTSETDEVEVVKMEFPKEPEKQKKLKKTPVELSDPPEGKIMFEIKNDGTVDL